MVTGPGTNDGRSQRAAGPNKNFNQYGGAPNTLVDEANEDEFWYQTPKANDIAGN